MRKSLYGGVCALLLILGSASNAAAASITEQFTLFYTSPGAFSISDLFFGIGSTNLIPAGNTDYTISTAGTKVTLFSERLVLDTAQTYTFSGSYTFGSGSSNQFSLSVLAPTSSETHITGTTSDGINFYLIGETLSPVPLPSSLPLFALALICLGAVGYYSRKGKTKDLPQAADTYIAA
jgi:hypothetical protein